MQKSNFSAAQRIQASLSIIFTFLLIHSKCTDLAQFQLPPCCYGQVPFLEQAASSESIVTTNPQGDVKSSSDEPGTHPNVTTENGSIHKFTYPMEFFEGSTNSSRTIEDRSVFKRTIEPGIDISGTNQSLANNSSNSDVNGSNIFDRVVQAEDHHADFNTSFKMPSTWELYLRRALYQSMSINSTLQDIASRSADAEEGESKLWQNIRDAKLQVIEPSTRKPSTKRIPELELTTDRISGVMVNTKDGVELRASASTFPGIPGEPCDCHLINHGDALLAYWSVGNSGTDSGVEYLVYPVPHNIPTPPVFLPFHTDKGLRPSPIDLNPSIQSDDHLRELPFQASLDFGVQTSQNTEFAEQLVGLKNEILSNTQRYGLGQSSNFKGVPVLPPEGPYPQFHHHVVEHFGIYPGAGNGIQSFPYPPFQQLHPEQIKELEMVRHFRKLSSEPVPIGEPQGPPPVPLPPPLNNPNSIQEIIIQQGPFPGDPFLLPPPCRPRGSDFGSYPIPECKPDFDRPGPGTGRPRPGDPDYGRYPEDPDYRPRPGDPDYGRYPGDSRPGDPDYGRYPGDRYPGDSNYRPRPGDPDYGRYPGDRYPGDSNYRPRPGDPDYGRYPGDADYRPNDRYPESPDYRPYSQNGLQVKGPPRTYNYDDRYGSSYSPPKVKYSTGAGSSSGKIRFADSGYPVSASTLKKREQKLNTYSGKESSYMLKF